MITNVHEHTDKTVLEMVGDLGFRVRSVPVLVETFVKLGKPNFVVDIRGCTNVTETNLRFVGELQAIVASAPPPGGKIEFLGIPDELRHVIVSGVMNTETLPSHPPSPTAN